MSRTIEYFRQLEVRTDELFDAIDEEAPGGGVELLAEDLRAIERELRPLLEAAEEKGGLE